MCHCHSHPHIDTRGRKEKKLDKSLQPLRESQTVVRSIPVESTVVGERTEEADTNVNHSKNKQKTDRRITLRSRRLMLNVDYS